jgi:hypothetical protein
MTLAAISAPSIKVNVLTSYSVSWVLTLQRGQMRIDAEARRELDWEDLAFCAFVACAVSWSFWLLHVFAPAVVVHVPWMGLAIPSRIIVPLAASIVPGLAAAILFKDSRRSIFALTIKPWALANRAFARGSNRDVTRHRQIPKLINHSAEKGKHTAYETIFTHRVVGTGSNRRRNHLRTLGPRMAEIHRRLGFWATGNKAHSLYGIGLGVGGFVPRPSHPAHLLRPPHFAGSPLACNSGKP